MADPSTCPLLIPASITEAHAKIAPYIHLTPLLTCKTLDEVASSPNPAAYLTDEPPTSASHTTTNGTSATTPPQFRLHFKCENLQKIGAFKARGAFHALTRLISELGLPELQSRGVITHSSGNHAQALALAASTFGVKAWIVMPRISTTSKILGVRRYVSEERVVFSGSTSVEREKVVAEVREREGCVLVPPYDHPDIVLGQGTVGREMELQFEVSQNEENGGGQEGRREFDAVIAPIGGGGLLGGIATWFSDKPDTLVFGAEPSFEGADDARRGLKEGKRVESVKSLTIADGLRTPVGVVNWGIVSDKSKVTGVYSVSENEIKMAMRLVIERMKVVVEPSAVVGLAVVLFNQEFRKLVSQKQKGGNGRAWDVGVVFSGGNTTLKAISGLFGEAEENESRNGVKVEREEGKIGLDGKRRVENVGG